MFDEITDENVGVDELYESEPLAPESTPGADVERVGPGQVSYYISNSFSTFS